MSIGLPGSATRSCVHTVIQCTQQCKSPRASYRSSHHRITRSTTPPHTHTKQYPAAYAALPAVHTTVPVSLYTLLPILSLQWRQTSMFLQVAMQTIISCWGARHSRCPPDLPFTGGNSVLYHGHGCRGPTKQRDEAITACQYCDIALWR